METDIDLHVITYIRQLLEQVLSNLVLELGWNGKNPLKLAVEKVRELYRNDIFLKASSISRTHSPISHWKYYLYSPTD